MKRKLIYPSVLVICLGMAFTSCSKKETAPEPGAVLQEYGYYSSDGLYINGVKVANPNLSMNLRKNSTSYGASGALDPSYVLPYWAGMRPASSDNSGVGAGGSIYSIYPDGNTITIQYTDWNNSFSQVKTIKTQVFPLVILDNGYIIKGPATGEDNLFGIINMPAGSEIRFLNSSTTNPYSNLTGNWESNNILIETGLFNGNVKKAIVNIDLKTSNYFNPTMWKINETLPLALTLLSADKKTFTVIYPKTANRAMSISSFKVNKLTSTEFWIEATNASNFYGVGDLVVGDELRLKAK